MKDMKPPKMPKVEKMGGNMPKSPQEHTRRHEEMSRGMMKDMNKGVGGGGRKMGGM